MGEPRSEGAVPDELARLKDRVDRLVHLRPQEALELAKEAVRTCGASDDARALAHRMLGMASYFAGELELARRSYQTCIDAYRAANARVEVARVQRSLIEVCLSAGAFEEALDHADAARGVFEQDGEDALLAGLEINVGNVWFRRDDYDRAREHYGRARAGFARGKDELGQAYAEFSLANLELAASRFPSAEQGFRSAMAIWERHGMQGRVADCTYSLAYLESRRGRFAEAIRGLEQARQAYQQGSKPSGDAYVDLDLAEITFRLGGWRDAQDHARRAADRFAELGLEYERAKATTLVGLSLASLGERARAGEVLSTAIEEFRRLGNETQADMLELQRVEARGLQRVDAAGVERLRAIHDRVRRSGQRLLLELSSLALAEALRHRGSADEAQRILDEVGPESALSVSLVAPELFVLRGRIAESLGDHDRARASFERAVELVEDTAGAMPGRDLRLAFFGNRREAYCRLVDAFARSGGPDGLERALGLLERSRALNLRREELPTETSKRLREARERVDGLLNRALDAELGSWGGPTGPRVSPAKEELDAAFEEVAALVRTSRRADTSRTVGASPAAAETPLEGTTVSFFHHGDSAWAFVSKEGTHHAVPLDLRGLDEAKDDLVHQLHRQQRLSGRDAATFARSQRVTDAILEELGELVLAPLREHLSERMAFVPYGLLQGLPIHAMRLDDAYLIEHTTVTYAPSLTFLRELAQRGSNPAAVLATGSVESSLPHVAQELRGLEERFGAALRRVPPEDLRAELEELAPRHSVLHLAAHGTFQPAHPLFSGVRLGSTFLTAYDVQSMQLPLDLVTLSGCETGRLLTTGAENSWGLQQAFFNAGARAIVSSLWPAADRETSELMESFYEHLSAGTDVGEALASAQRALLRSGSPAFLWAPFVVTGDGTTNPWAP